MRLLGGDNALWKGGLNIGRKILAKPLPNAAPRAGADAATAIAGSTITIDVLTNDVDPEGGALRVTAAMADIGDASVNPDNTLAYVAPEAFSGVATISYTLTDEAGETGDGSVEVEVVSLSLAKGAVDGEFHAICLPGELTITVSEPTDAQGTYVLQTADLGTGPVNLLPPRIRGVSENDTTLSALPGLWAFDEVDAPFNVARQWYRNQEPIADQTGSSYAINADLDAGKTLRLVETATTPSGMRMSESLAVDGPAKAPEVQPKIEAWTPAALPGLALWLDAADAATLSVTEGTITEWADKSGNGRHASQIANTAGPRLGAEINGTPILSFPKNSALRSRGSALPGLPGMPGVTIVAVTQGHVAETFSECVSIHDDASNSGRFVSVQTGLSMAWFGNGNRYWTNSAAEPVIAVFSYAASGTHGDTRFWGNGRELSSTSTAKSGGKALLPSNAYMQIGDSSGSSSEKAEILFLMESLEDSDREKLEGYLAHKWGLAGNLSDTHPYKVAPPAI